MLVVKVSHWRAPFYLKKEGMPSGVYVRLGSTSRPASPELLAELQRSSLTLSFDQQPLPDLSKEDLEMDWAISSFKAINKNLTEDQLRTLGILTQFERRFVPTVGGLILFGKKSGRDQIVPDAKVNCARFQGETKTHILDRQEVEGTILTAVQEVSKFIARNTRLTAEIQRIRRRDIPEYSPVAIREALINALVHSDYSLKGSPIQIAIFNDRLEIQNPGMLPFGFTLEDLRAGMSRVRNRIIARVFRELKLMEEWGSGYKRIIEACHQGGYPEPKWEELGTFIRVTFYPHSKTRILETSELEPNRGIMDREMAILALFKKGESLPFREIYERLSYQVSERMLRYDLTQLKKKGLLVSKGKGRAIVWQKIGK